MTKFSLNKATKCTTSLHQRLGNFTCQIKQRRKMENIICDLVWTSNST